MTDEDKIADLKRKLDKRRNTPGYEENVRELEAEIAQLESKA